MSAPTVGVDRDAVYRKINWRLLLVCRNSDRVGERKWHMLVTGMLATAAYLAFSLASGSLWGMGILVAIATAGQQSAQGEMRDIAGAAFAG